MFYGFTQQTFDCIAVRLTGVALVVKNYGYTGVGSLEYRLGFRNDAQQGHGQNLFHVFDAEHLAIADALRVVTGQRGLVGGS